MKDDWTREEIERALEEDETATLKAGKPQDKTRWMDMAVGWLTGVLMGAVIFILATGVSGCHHYDGMRVVEGTHFALGVNIPYVESAQMNFLDYSSGLVAGVTSNAQTTITYYHAETNDWFWGMVLTRIHRTMQMEVVPCEVSAAEAGTNDFTQTIQRTTQEN